VASPLFPNGIEYHSFFDPSRLSEYLFNQREIHSGRYAFQGNFNGSLRLKHIIWPNNDNPYSTAGDAIVMSSNIKHSRSPSRISPQIVASVEEDDFSKIAKYKLTPAKLKEILSYCDEIGALGEQAVLAAERKRLRRLGFRDQANKVKRVSLWSVGEGFDILSFENDGITKRYLEVKTTVGYGTIVDVSGTEWKAAQRFKEKYYLVRVIRVNTTPEIFFIKNPSDLLRRGMFALTPSGWKIDLRAAMNASD
jgi:Domain of unknown function (DUF3883)